MQGIEMTEYNGIKPNPRVEDVNEAARLGRTAGVDMVVAVGGGSVIDSAKIIAICIAEEADGWQVMTGKHKPASALPLIAVLTLAATGTEMNAVSVLQNPETMEKIGYRNDLIYPVHSFLDPGYTQTVPDNYTAYGVVDLVSYVDGIMWAATCALNNLTIYGRESGDWGVHALGHVLSFLYDTPHGATLSIIYPAWMKVMKERAGDRILKLGKALWGTSDVDETIKSLESFITQLGSPLKCQEVGIEASKKEEILALMNKHNAGGMNYGLSDEERQKLIGHMF